MTRAAHARFLVLLPLLLAPACGDGGPRPYSNNDLELITAYTAKEVCSCRFVMQQSAAYCLAFTRASPAVASFRVNEKHREVTATALGLWSAHARFISRQEGCRLNKRLNDR